MWYALIAPAGTPRAIIERLNTEAVRVLKEPAYRKRLVNSAIDPVGSLPEALAKYIKSEIDKYAKVVKEANVRID